MIQNRLYEMIVPVALLALVGAIVSKGVKVGTLHPLWIIAMAIPGGLVWAWTVKRFEASLAVTGSYYDIIYSLVYFAAFIVMGEKVTAIQLVGIGLSIVGMVLLQH